MSGVEPAPRGVVIVDHGSRRDEANSLLLEVVAEYARWSGEPIVEPAHMELAEPSIETAVDRCVARGARHIVVCPFFLLPGRHWDTDIPQLTASATARHPGVTSLVVRPLGPHPLLLEIMRQRIALEP